MAFNNQVFPAHAGMFLKSDAYQAVAIRFPRARGDVPEGESLWLSIIKFSPRTRGCSSGKTGMKTVPSVFPAHAGMFLTPPPLLRWWKGFPRARGDVPM